MNFKGCQDLNYKKAIEIIEKDNTVRKNSSISSTAVECGSMTSTNCMDLMREKLDLVEDDVIAKAANSEVQVKPYRPRYDDLKMRKLASKRFLEDFGCDGKNVRSACPM